MNVKKKNGTIQAFTPSKLERAINNALLEAKEWKMKLFLDIVRDVKSSLGEEVDVKKIHTSIVNEFSKRELFDSVKAYMDYYTKKDKTKQWLMTDLQRDIWERKYKDGNETFDNWIKRISNGDKALAKLIQEKKFLFGGRILANRGLGRKITYSNCYVLSKPEDNIESIFGTATKLARTYSYGGGVGIDIENLRPRGAEVDNAARTTTGAVSFMDLYSTTTGLIGQNGRRGALMISIPCTHPDLEEFIDVKTDLTKVTKANISVRLNDSFMRAAEMGHMFTLSFETEHESITKIVDARRLLMKMALNNWRTAEPGALFWDKIESYHMMSEFDDFKYAGVNPCAEEPLPAGGSCLLGSLNLSEFVNLPFTEHAYFSIDKFEEAVGMAVIALNDVLDEGMDLHPLQEQKDSVRDYRQIGLGVMGIADMLIKLGYVYGSITANKFCKSIAERLANYALQASARLAKEKGVFPKYKKSKLLASEYIRTVADVDTLDLIEKYGLRNSQLLTIAPTGSISTMIGISGGIEPIFALSSTRKTESLYENEKTYKVFAQIVKDWQEETGGTLSDLPHFFVESHNVAWYNRIEMQSVWQKYIDASISSTINLPNETTPDEVFKIYVEAWKHGLKGMTIYRDGCERAGILAVDDDNTSEEKPSNICPECGNELNMSGGCSDCPECGWSKCAL